MIFQKKVKKITNTSSTSFSSCSKDYRDNWISCMLLNATQWEWSGNQELHIAKWTKKRNKLI